MARDLIAVVTEAPAESLRGKGRYAEPHGASLGQTTCQRPHAHDGVRAPSSRQADGRADRGGRVEPWPSPRHAQRRRLRRDERRVAHGDPSRTARLSAGDRRRVDAR